MNKTRRRELAAIAEALSELQDRLDTVISEEQSSYDNLPEGLQNGEKGGKMEETIELMESAKDEIGEACVSLDEAQNI